MNKPLVSIIMPAYNNDSTIMLAINSVLEQTYSNWELIISDDNSKDRTLEIVNHIMLSDVRIKLLKHSKNSGAGFARNAAIEKAMGKYIAFLDSDDLWHPNKLEEQIFFMATNQVALSYSQYQKIDIKGNLGKVIIPPAKVTYSELLKSNVIGCLTAVYDQDILGKIFMPTIRKRQDMALWLKILEKTDAAYCVPKVLAYYREGQKSLSSNKFKILLSQWDFYRSYLRLGCFRSSYYFAFYACKALKKHK